MNHSANYSKCFTIDAIGLQHGVNNYQSRKVTVEITSSRLAFKVPFDDHFSLKKIALKSAPQSQQLILETDGFLLKFLKDRNREFCEMILEAIEQSKSSKDSKKASKLPIRGGAETSNSQSFYIQKTIKNNNVTAVHYPAKSSGGKLETGSKSSGEVSRISNVKNTNTSPAAARVSSGSTASVTSTSMVRSPTETKGRVYTNSPLSISKQRSLLETKDQSPNDGRLAAVGVLSDKKRHLEQQHLDSFKTMFGSPLRKQPMKTYARPRSGSFTTPSINFSQLTSPSHKIPPVESADGMDDKDDMYQQSESYVPSTHMKTRYSSPAKLEAGKYSPFKEPKNAPSESPKRSLGTKAELSLFFTNIKAHQQNIKKVQLPEEMPSNVQSWYDDENEAGNNADKFSPLRHPAANKTDFLDQYFVQKNNLFSSFSKQSSLPLYEGFLGGIRNLGNTCYMSSILQVS